MLDNQRQSILSDSETDGTAFSWVMQCCNVRSADHTSQEMGGIEDRSKTLHISLCRNRSSTEISHCFRSSAVHQDHVCSKTLETPVAIDGYWKPFKSARFLVSILSCRYCRHDKKLVFFIPHSDWAMFWLMHQYLPVANLISLMTYLKCCQNVCFWLVHLQLLNKECLITIFKVRFCISN